MIWRAKWIWVAGCSGNHNCYIYARREFDLENVVDAELRVACSSEYKAFINGRYVGRGAAQCGRSYHPADRYDIKGFLRPGPNVIGLIGHNRGVDSAQGPAKPGGVLAQIDLACVEDPVVVTDEEWRVTLARELDPESPRISASSGFQEVYDSRLKPVGWNVVGFDDSGWETPEVLGEASRNPWGVLIHRTIPCLEENDLLPAGVIVPESGTVRYPRSLLSASGDYATITPGHDRAIVMDFGRQVVGFPEISVLDGGVAAADIGYSTAVTADGAVCPAEDGIAQADRVVLHGGRQEWQAFGRRAFRYMQLTFRDVRSPILVRGVTVSGIGYPIRRAWEFECSDDTLNAAYEAGAQALSLCMQDTYEPDPFCDQRSRPSEARMLALANYYVFGDTALAASDLRRFAQDMDECGAQSDQRQLLDWVLMLHEYYLHSGDGSVVDDLYPHVRQALDECAGPVDSSAAGCALYYQSLRDASKLALAVEAFDDAKAWHEKSREVLAAFDDRFWDEDESCYGDTTANVMAVAGGMADTHRAGLVSDDIARHARDLPPQMLFYLLGALVKLDLTSEALNVIRAGRVDGDRLPMWLRAVPAQFLASEALGIRPYMVRQLGITVQPRMGGLEWARGRFALLETRLSVEWKRSEDEFSLEIDGSGGCVVAIGVDGFVSPVVHEIDLTPETPERRARKTYGWGDVIWRGGEERDPYLDWLETQDAEPPDYYQSTSRCEIGGGYVWVREPVSTHVRYLVHDG